MKFDLFKNKRLLLIFFLIFLIGLAVALVSFFFSRHYSRQAQPTTTTTPSTTTSLNQLKQTNHLTNFLILGIGGQGHQAPNLTDTIILVSYNHQTHHVTTIPLPRDLWSDTYHAKINTFYQLSLDQYPNDPLTHTKALMSDVIGLPIHYLVILDFNGFVKLVDLVGGLDIKVKRTFDDYKYPIPGKENAEPESARYEHLHFDAGWQHMDGQLALKFARSRHALGPEGSDFARSQRQEQVMQAFLKKLFSSSVLLKPQTLAKLKTQLQNSLITDLSPSDLPAILKLVFLIKKNPANLRSDSIVSLLKEPHNLQPYGGQWVLLPKTNWQAIHDYINQAVNH